MDDLSLSLFAFMSGGGGMVVSLVIGIAVTTS